MPTDFAKFCAKHIPKKSTILDVGCGNGRDSYYFLKYRHKIIGIDYAILPKATGRSIFIKTDIRTLFKMECSANVVYSRFFLHAITDKEICSLLKWSKGLFMAEFRAKGDRPVLYHRHKRNLIGEHDFLHLLRKYGFDVLYYIKGYNMARYKNENPLVIRVIARKML